MPNPEAYRIIEDYTYIYAVDEVRKEWDHADTTREFLDGLVATYGTPEPRQHEEEGGGELIFHGPDVFSTDLSLLTGAPPQQNSPSKQGSEGVIFSGPNLLATDLNKLTEIAHYLHPEADPTSREFIGFLEGTLLGRHTLHHVNVDLDPVYEAQRFIRERIIRSAPQWKIQWGPSDDYIWENIHLAPAEDTTENDPNAFNDDLHVRQKRISQSVDSKLYPYGGDPVTPFEETVQDIANDIAKIYSSEEANALLKGYRFMMTLYTNPDQRHRAQDLGLAIDTLIKKNQADTSEPQYSDFQRSTEAIPKSLVTLALDLDRTERGARELTYLKGVFFDILTAEFARFEDQGILDEKTLLGILKHCEAKLNRTNKKEGYLKKGDLLSFTGDFFMLIDGIEMPNGSTKSDYMHITDEHVIEGFFGGNCDAFHRPGNR